MKFSLVLLSIVCVISYQGVIKTQENDREQLSAEQQIEEIFNRISIESEQQNDNEQGNQNAQNEDGQQSMEESESSDDQTNESDMNTQGDSNQVEETQQENQKITIQLNPDLREEPELRQVETVLNPNQLIFNQSPEQLISEEIVINEYEDQIQRALEWAKEKVVLEDDQLRELQLQAQIKRRNQLLEQQQKLINQKLQETQQEPQQQQTQQPQDRVQQSNQGTPLPPRIIVISQQPQQNQQQSGQQRQGIPIQQGFRQSQQYQRSPIQQIIIRQPPAPQVQFQNVKPKIQRQQPTQVRYQQTQQGQGSRTSSQIRNRQPQQQLNQYGQQQYQYQYPADLFQSGNYQTVGQFSQSLGDASDYNWQQTDQQSSNQGDVIQPQSIDQEIDNMVNQLTQKYSNDWIESNYNYQLNQ